MDLKRTESAGTLAVAGDTVVAAGEAEAGQRLWWLPLLVFVVIGRVAKNKIYELI